MQEGDYLLSHVGFLPDNHPYIHLRNHDGLSRFNPIGHTLTLRFDTSQRFCRGWHDLRTGEDAPCPDSQQVDAKYDQCAACQSRTGFNPAFYHAKTVSPQQEARNLEPHFLYLAYFAENIIKVGISHAKRDNARLLEQGARSALILDTFPSAHIARHYEERIAALPGIYETVQLGKKIAKLDHIHSPEAAATTLLATKEGIEDVLKVSFTNTLVQHFNSLYFPDKHPNLGNAYDCSTDHIISGKVIGMIGTVLICWQQDTPVFLPLKKYTGFRMTLTLEETPLDLPAQQISLF
jgi:hypothetical protein